MIRYFDLFYFVKSVRVTIAFSAILLREFTLFREQRMQVQHFSHTTPNICLSNMDDKVHRFKNHVLNESNSSL